VLPAAIDIVETPVFDRQAPASRNMSEEVQTIFVAAIRFVTVPKRSNERKTLCKGM
jgi:hypothetical protein